MQTPQYSQTIAARDGSSIVAVYDMNILLLSGSRTRHDEFFNKVLPFSASRPKDP